MNRRWQWGLGLVCVVVCAACRPSKPAAPPPPLLDPPPIRAYARTNAQAKLPTMILWVGDQKVVAEVARTPAELATGLMFRPALGENDGMLCVFAGPARVAFHTKNTSIPLSVAFLDGEGTVLELHDLKPLDATPVEAKSDQVQFALEMNQGWFKKRRISPGVVVRSERGSLADALKPRRPGP